MTALVTGGAGFIGSHLVRALLERGDSVRVLDDFSSGVTENLALLTGPLQIFSGSILDASILGRAIEGCSAVFHLAAIASVPQSVADPIGTERVNVEGSIRVFEAALKVGAKVVLSSSSAAYGDKAAIPAAESEAPAPISPYAVQKLAAEGYLRSAHANYGLAGVSLRYFNVFGPRQNPDSEYAAVVPKFVTRALEGRPLVIYGDGSQTRDFIYVEDVVRANLLALESGSRTGEVFNVGSGKGISIRQLAETVIDALESKSKIEFQSPRPGDVRDSRADGAGAKAAILFEPTIDLAEGLRRTADYWRALTVA